MAHALEIIKYLVRLSLEDLHLCIQAETVGTNHLHQQNIKGKQKESEVAQVKLWTNCIFLTSLASENQ